MNWGLKIVLLYVGFVAMILTMVFMTMQHKVDLVADDYYQQELNYQQQINKMEQAGSLGAKPSVKPDMKGMIIELPEELRGADLSGSVYCYRPSDSEKDVTVSLQPDSSGVQLIPADKFVKGLYTVKLNWTKEGNNYYSEYSVYMP
ncbi:MAG: hypothetical protein Fur0041_10630 [Bacteroidia bacterium]